MKKIILCIAIVSILIAFGGNNTSSNIVLEKTSIPISEVNSVENKDETTVLNVVKDESSILKWTGSAVGKSHYGTVDYNGSLNILGNKLIGGELIFDMKTINTKDLEGEWKQKLDNHLMNPDFFNVDSFPTAKFIIKEYNGEILSGDLTIKKVTKKISFPAKVTVSENSLEGSAKFSINRTDYGVVYGSGSLFDLAKDRVISDDIDFEVSIKASK